MLAVAPACSSCWWCGTAPCTSLGGCWLAAKQPASLLLLLLAHKSHVLLLLVPAGLSVMQPSYGKVPTTAAAAAWEGLEG